MKRIITAVAAVGLAASLVACAGGGDLKTASSTKSTTATTSATASAYDIEQALTRGWDTLSESQKNTVCASKSSRYDYLSPSLAPLNLGGVDAAQYAIDQFASSKCAEYQADRQQKQAEAAKAKLVRSPASYAAISKRALAKVLRDPDSYTGKRYVIYGEVTQFDSATGSDAFRADVAYRDIREYGIWVGGDNAMVSKGLAKLDDIVQDDIVKMYVEVVGSMSYDTQLGGNTTVAEFKVNIIKRIGTSE